MKYTDKNIAEVTQKIPSLNSMFLIGSDLVNNYVIWATYKNIRPRATRLPIEGLTPPFANPIGIAKYFEKSQKNGKKRQKRPIWVLWGYYLHPRPSRGDVGAAIRTSLPPHTVVIGRAKFCPSQYFQKNSAADWHSDTFCIYCQLTNFLYLYLQLSMCLRRGPIWTYKMFINYTHS